ncbi:hypothetical protein V6N12_044970 [Hibiscus sabdariffa]|uniref:Uncharacterized protein n=1 Tax=Hibiscus sabdariffa TaxID=183260 RepID=A0ABR2G1E5_9ROSI
MADTPSVTEDTPRSGDRANNCQVNNLWLVPSSQASIEAMRRIKVGGAVIVRSFWKSLKRKKKMGLELMQFLVRVSRLASSIGSMALGRSQVDDGIGEESN